MVCTRCRGDWCWLCGQDISTTTTGNEVDYHFSPTNLRGCPGSQFSQGGILPWCTWRNSLVQNYFYFTIILFPLPSLLAGNGEFLCLERLTSYIWWIVFCAVIVLAIFLYLGALVAITVATGCCFACCCCTKCFSLARIDSEALQAFLIGPPLMFSLTFMTLLWVVIALVSQLLFIRYSNRSQKRAA